MWSKFKWKVNIFTQCYCLKMLWQYKQSSKSMLPINAWKQVQKCHARNWDEPLFHTMSCVLDQEKEDSFSSLVSWCYNHEQQCGYTACSVMKNSHHLTVWHGTSQNSLKQGLKPILLYQKWNVISVTKRYFKDRIAKGTLRSHWL